MNQEIENELVNNENEDELDDDFDIEFESDMESDVDSDVESDTDDEFDTMYSEILEATNRNVEHLQLLKKSFSSVKLELFDVRELWFRKFFKELETANVSVEQIEDELFEMSD